jgi:hypothetical protein
MEAKGEETTMKICSENQCPGIVDDYYRKDQLRLDVRGGVAGSLRMTGKGKEQVEHGRRK